MRRQPSIWIRVIPCSRPERPSETLRAFDVGRAVGFKEGIRDSQRLRDSLSELLTAIRTGTVREFYERHRDDLDDD